MEVEENGDVMCRVETTPQSQPIATLLTPLIVKWPCRNIYIYIYMYVCMYVNIKTKFTSYIYIYIYKIFTNINLKLIWMVIIFFLNLEERKFLVHCGTKKIALKLDI